MNPITIPDDALKRFRDAASKFARHAAPRASRLLSLKDDIAALRDKGASFRTISELLTQNGIAASDTCVMRFCRRELVRQPIRCAKRKPVAALKTTASTNRIAAPPAAMTPVSYQPAEVSVFYLRRRCNRFLSETIHL